MQRTRPLPDIHPELSVTEWPSFREYRVENWRLARDGSGSIVPGATSWEWIDLCLPVVFSFIWSRVRGSIILCAFAVLAVAFITYCRCTQVLHESVLVFPTHGIQLETHRGYPLLKPLFVSRRFIHVSFLEDFIINEGLRRWNVRYYLAAVHRSSTDTIAIDVAFENILPYFPVLLEVYQGVQELMFHRPTNNAHIHI
ncbi:hypothetical protein K503DRAFT_125953 [Rhizopogon vinicolor AM-OR11-026]|uniref:Phosphatidylinositol N-acetylglucosaminyltransferase subunit H conserved domain-containing protein n=1 Tax=Rhizopogon vinicolor AM-OR11-026 TaxID=1314800 RepID=A0A1B7NF89_9AGAM|nr:hypothetical protein K503DRAFT_125953 [Rhizopogon vinicolor AM-OR11-026]